jgi:DNA helicase-2/ATP-dependent DNA helicase PcrA
MHIENLWQEFDFEPNPGQRKAILHTDGPLLITAGPGSGKTRVLLWRTVNLIVFQDISPDEIFLSTFTEKAARQLKDGLRNILGYITNKTGQPYDISNMAIGTVHSICQKMIADRRFSSGGSRFAIPRLMDSLDQYFHVGRNLWEELMQLGEFEFNEDYHSYNHGHLFVNQYVMEKELGGKHLAVTNLINAFNRFSEESFSTRLIQLELEEEDQKMLSLYQRYCEDLQGEVASKVDFALLQHQALQVLEANPASQGIFKHIIIDEYQDTNTIQERLFFQLAQTHQNICVVGDDDQALYRFRGATVENLVQFSERCERYLGIPAQRINLQINYRSRKQIVDCYTAFMEQMDWSRTDGRGHYRVMDKGITAHSTDDGPAVVTTDRRTDKAEVYAEVVQRIVELKEKGKIRDYNQVAFLFPSLRYQGEPNQAVKDWKQALEEAGIPMYAPRAGRFLDIEESLGIFGIFLKIFNMPNPLEIQSRNYQNFTGWLRNARHFAEDLIEEDALLKEFIADKRSEWKEKEADYALLLRFFEKKRITPQDVYDPLLQREVAAIPGLSESAQRIFARHSFQELIRRRYMDRNPFNVRYIIDRLTSLDWSLLDLFYQLLGFDHFKRMFDLAEDGTDEGPICNLSLISGYLARFLDQYATLLTGSFLYEKRFVNTFFNSYCYALYRLAETEYEDAEDPFPKGRVPFITVHQSKGLEFPVVVLGNLNKRDFGPNPLDVRIQSMTQKEGEPLDRYSGFDIMRMFYVALSRAKNLVILPEKKRGQVYQHLKFIRELDLPLLSELDMNNIPAAKLEIDDIGGSYSYTGDYLSYLKCPRYYMIFRKYDFAPSRSQSMFFGSLVHRTIEDLHLFLIQQKESSA